VLLQKIFNRKVAKTQIKILLPFQLTFLTANNPTPAPPLKGEGTGGVIRLEKYDPCRVNVKIIIGNGQKVYKRVNLCSNNTLV
jgi:hypothetical protein